MASPCLVFLHAGLSGFRFERRRLSSDQPFAAHDEFADALLAFSPYDRRPLEERLHRGFFRVASSACGIRCLDFRTERCSQRFFLDADPLPLCRLYGKTGHPKILAGRAWFCMRADEQADGRYPAGRAAVAGLLAAQAFCVGTEKPVVANKRKISLLSVIRVCCHHNALRSESVGYQTVSS
ncbi:MAG: hypothetical protein BWX55_00937 [Deltaproteobacteria bacterium ADurb.Bin022]|nr:MAG: hypothetical protein BWX55_00937 [Deltaproteobacteria bacterium ADurb.Bin022]